MRRFDSTLSVRELFGPMTKLATIRPPGPSYRDWHRFLEDCREAGIAGVEGKAFATPLGYALLRRWRWLEDSERMGIVYEAAEAAFDAAIERDRHGIETSLDEQERTRARALSERNGKRQPIEDADALFAHAERTIV